MAAAARHTELEGAIRRVAAGLAQTAAALAHAADEVSVVVRLVDAADLLARRNGLAITDDGRVVDLPVFVPVANPFLAAGIDHAREVARAELPPDLERILDLARAADAALRAALVEAAGVASRPPGSPALPGAARGVPDIPASTAVPGPGPVDVPDGLASAGWSPPHRAAWWALLSPQQREWVLVERPDVVGGSDGLPAWARDRANRVIMDRDEARLVEEEARLRPSGAGLPDVAVAGSVIYGPVPPSSAPAGGTSAQTYSQVVAMLASVRAVREVLGRRDGRARQLLVLDTRGRLAEAAVATGDVDRAGHVAVFVGGLSTTVDADLRGYDDDLGALAEQARRLARDAGDAREVSAVAWLGYQAPQMDELLDPDRSVLLPLSARAGARKLAAFTTGLGAARRPGDPLHLSLLAHSYGSTTAGLSVAGSAAPRIAAPARGGPVPRSPESPPSKSARSVRGTAVGDLAVFGSPGLGVAASRDLLVTPAHVHVLEADDDLVADSAWLGPDPSQLAGVDVLSTARTTRSDGSVGRGSSGHSDYLTPGTTSAWNLAAVVAGTPQLLVRGSGCGASTVPTEISRHLGRAG